MAFSSEPGSDLTRGRATGSFEEDAGKIRNEKFGLEPDFN
jgi:hypothetical protein